LTALGVPCKSIGDKVRIMELRQLSRGGDDEIRASQDEP
jgi:hypothetical protein